MPGNDGEILGERAGLVSTSMSSAVLDSALPGSPDAAIAEKLRQLAVALDELAQVDVSTLSDAAVAEAAGPQWGAAAIADAPRLEECLAAAMRLWQGSLHA